MSRSRNWTVGPRLIALAMICVTVLTGCAVSREQFQRERYSLRDDEICRALLYARKEYDYSYQDELSDELQRRGVQTYSCSSLVADADRRATAALVGVLAAATVVAIAKNSNGGGGGYYGDQIDYDWAWDEFYDQHYSLVWACRGKQTGQFAEFSNCRNKLKVDHTWPAKTAPGR